MAKARDGWHVVRGRDVYVEGGIVIRGMKHNGRLSAYPYRKAKQPHCWIREDMTLAAFSAGVRRGTVELH